MRLVLLAGSGLEQRYLAERLLAEFGADVKAIVVDDPPPKPMLERVRRYTRRYTLRQLASRFWAKAYGRLTGRERRRADTYRTRFSFRRDSEAFSRADLIRRVPSHNGPECLALLEEIQPDIIAVYGTAIIKPPVIRQARKAILNMHTGVSPRYRGADSVFWPLHNGEPEWVGVTVHLLDEGVDSGAIIRTGRPVIEPEDDEDTLFCKCVILGAGLYAEAIREVVAAKRSFPVQELEKGREYRFVDRTVAAERRVRRLLRDGLLRRHADRTPSPSR